MLIIYKMTRLTTTFVLFGIILISGIWGSPSPGDSALEETLMEMKELMIDLRDRVDKQDSKILELTKKSKEEQIRAQLTSSDPASDVNPANLFKRAKTGDQSSATDSRCFPYPGLYTTACRQGKQGDRGRDGRDGRDGPPGKDGLTPEQLQKVLENILKFKEKADEDKVTTGRYDSGAVYVRWGRTKCPDHSQLVYKGWAGGSWYKHSGGGSTKLCLPEDPQYLKTKADLQGANYLHGAEYQLHGIDDVFSNKNTRSHTLENADVPCAVCLATSRPSLVMIPAKWECDEGWTREYYGYLMTERYNHHRSSFDCVDLAPEMRNGGHANKDGALFYFVEGSCGHALPCPPYIQGAELTCAVCTR